MLFRQRWPAYQVLGKFGFCSRHVRSYKIEKFRSFKLIELDLSPLSVLIGPNGGGKSNFLDLLSLLAEAASGHLAEGVARRGGFDDIAFKGDPGDIFVEIHFEPRGAFQEERTPVFFKLMLKKVGSNPKVWYEQVSKAPSATAPSNMEGGRRTP
jgi:predicted ATPase